MRRKLSILAEVCKWIDGSIKCPFVNQCVEGPHHPGHVVSSPSCLQESWYLGCLGLALEEMGLVGQAERLRLVLLQPPFCLRADQAIMSHISASKAIFGPLGH